MKSFKDMIRTGEVKRADAIKVQLQDIHEEPGFNLRVENEELTASIEELAAYIMAGGIVPPLEVRPRDEGGVWLVDGHRRTRAYKLAAQRGAPIDWINVVPFRGNDADRVARVITSAEGRPLSPIEMAAGCKRLAAFGLSNQEIAAKINKTPQRVAQLLELSEAPTAVQKMVAAGEVSATTAAKVVKEHGDKATEVLRDAKTEGKKVTPKALAKDKPKALPAKVAQELEESAWALSKHLPLQTHEVLEHGLRNGVASIADKDVLVPAGFLLELVMAAQAANDARGKQHERILADQQIKAQQALEGVA